MARSVLVPPTSPAISICLPPGLGLDAVRETARPVPERDPAHGPAQRVRPRGVGQERAQDRAAEELPPRADLGRDRELAQPPGLEARAALGVVESGFERDGETLREEDLRAPPQRHTLVPPRPGAARA